METVMHCQDDLVSTTESWIVDSVKGKLPGLP